MGKRMIEFWSLNKWIINKLHFFFYKHLNNDDSLKKKTHKLEKSIDSKKQTGRKNLGRFDYANFKTLFFFFY